MPFVQTNGMRLYYEQHGTGEPLVCVMGLSGDCLAWGLQVPAFAARHRTIVFDNRDVGQSSYADGDYETEDMARDTLGLADALGLDAFHLLGMSLGGLVCQHVALIAPERVRTLQLAACFAGSGRYARERARVWSVEARRLRPEEFLDLLMLLTLCEESYEDEQWIEFTRSMALTNPFPQSPEAFGRQAGAGSRHDLRGRLGSLSMPVHVIATPQDLIVPLWKQEELAAEIPGAQLTVIPGAPHVVNVERAKPFNAAVLDFTAARAPARTVST